MKITESQIKDIVAQVLSETIFGLNGNDLQQMGLKNPADDYPVNYQEIVQKCKEFLPMLQSFCDYIYGIEEDEEKGIKATKGAYSNMRMRGMWNNDDDEIYFSGQLRDMCEKLFTAKSIIDEFIDFYENK